MKNCLAEAFRIVTGIDIEKELDVSNREFSDGETTGYHISEIVYFLHKRGIHIVEFPSECAIENHKGLRYTFKPYDLREVMQDQTGVFCYAERFCDHALAWKNNEFINPSGRPISNHNFEGTFFMLTNP